MGHSLGGQSQNGAVVQQVGCEAGDLITQASFSNLWWCRGIFLLLLEVPIVAMFSSVLKYADFLTNENGAQSVQCVISHVIFLVHGLLETFALLGFMSPTVAILALETGPTVMAFNQDFSHTWLQAGQLSRLTLVMSAPWDSPLQCLHGCSGCGVFGVCFTANTTGSTLTVLRSDLTLIS